MDFKPFKIGKFLLLERIATGGMAEVYRAKASGPGGFEKQLAVKRIIPSYAANEEFRRMFEYEARLSSMLTHANIAQIYDFVKASNTYLLALEYVNGKNLRQFVNKSKRNQFKVPIEFSVFVINEVCKGLEYAHKKKDDLSGKPLNIIHRDMSPQNVMVSYDGAVKIVDFGIAKARGRVDETRSGVIKGKFGYMSPEQAMGEPVDHRTDIFSTGIILCEMLMGKRLFAADNDMATLRRIQECVVQRPSLTNPKIHPDLEKIVLKALTKDRNTRYQSAGAFHRRLQEYLNKHHPTLSQREVSEIMRDLFKEEIQIEQKRLEQAYRQSIPFSQGSPEAENEQIDVVIDEDPTKSEDNIKTEATFSGVDKPDEVQNERPVPSEAKSVKKEPSIDNANTEIESLILDDDSISTLGKEKPEEVEAASPKPNTEEEKDLDNEEMDKTVHSQSHISRSEMMEPEPSIHEMPVLQAETAEEPSAEEEAPKEPSVDPPADPPPKRDASLSKSIESEPPAESKLNEEPSKEAEVSAKPPTLDDPSVEIEFSDPEVSNHEQTSDTEDNSAADRTNHTNPDAEFDKDSSLTFTFDEEESTDSEMGGAKNHTSFNEVLKIEHSQASSIDTIKAPHIEVREKSYTGSLEPDRRAHINELKQVHADPKIESKTELTVRFMLSITAVIFVVAGLAYLVFIPKMIKTEDPTVTEQSAPTQRDRIFAGAKNLCETELATYPTQANIKINGKKIDEVTPTSLSLPCDTSVEIGFSLINHQDYNSKYKVTRIGDGLSVKELKGGRFITSKGKNRVYVPLTKIESGELILTLSQNADVIINGQKIKRGIAGQRFSISLPKGNYKVQFKNELLGIDTTKQFNIIENQAVRRDVILPIPNN